MRSAPRAIFAATAFLAISVPISAAAGPPAGVQGAAARDVTRAAPSNQPASSVITVGDPQKAAAIGLPGLKEGDKVEVSRGPDGTWIVRDPASGNAATLAQPPDFGR